MSTVKISDKKALGLIYKRNDRIIMWYDYVLRSWGDFMHDENYQLAVADRQYYTDQNKQIIEFLTEDDNE